MSYSSYSPAYNLGHGKVEVGMEVIYLPPGERAKAGRVIDITQDGDITIELIRDSNKIVTTKWQYVEPRNKK